jgi:hypothetical protein
MNHGHREPVRIKYTEGCDFLRGEHPDTRSNKEFLKALDIFLLRNKISKNIIKGNRKPIMCIETKIVFGSRLECCREMGISVSLMSRHVNGLLKTAGGYTFKHL